MEDLASALIKFDNGSTLSLEVSWTAHTDIENNGAFIHLMDSQGGASLRSMSAGKLFLEAFDRAVDIDLSHPAEDAGARYRLSHHFIDCIREGKESITTAQTGFVNNVIIDAIYESSRTGKLIELNFDY